MKKVLFHRDFAGFTGGHLKVWDYFNHVRHSTRYRPFIRFSRESLWDESNPWRGAEGVLAPDAPLDADILFLGGLDWLMLEPRARDDSRIPIVNLVQGARHAQPGDPRYPFLRHRAARICVSEAVAAALAESGQANGPVRVIPNGLDLAGLPAPLPQAGRDIDVLVSALKQPALGAELAQRLAHSGHHAGRRVELLGAALPRPRFLDAMRRARIAVHLPLRAEGFYLPPLESMALETLVVCPDCVGNRSWCIPGDNCFRPDYALEPLVRDAEAALALPAAGRARMLERARATVARHDLMAERRAFLGLLDELERIW